MSPPTLQRPARLILVLGICTALALVAGQPATAQYSSDFESPLYTGSAAGEIITGQDAFYIPVTDSQDGLVYTYASNALGLPANPSGGGLQFAGVTGGDPGLPVPFARAQRDISYTTGAWTVSFDIAVTFIGDLPSAQNIGSFSTQAFPEDATFIALARWSDPDTAANWNADYVWFDAGGVQLTEVVPNAGFQNLLVNHWYRWSTTFNIDTNQIVQISITDLSTNVTVTHNPADRFLSGGSGGGTLPTGFRLFGGALGVAGNTLAFDNVDIDLASGTPSGACCFEDESCDFLTEDDCLAGGGTYQGDWTGCTAQLCITIPEVCGKGAGFCGEPSGSPGCEDELCCALVCLQDPFCCAVKWNDTCVTLALQICDLPPCQLEAPKGSIREGEDNCGLPDTFNGGCNLDPPLFSPIHCGDTIFGSGAFNGATRDTDWYQLELNQETDITFTVTAEFDAVIGVIEYNPGFEGSGNCDDISGFINPAATPFACEEGSVMATLGPGIWWLFVAPDFTNTETCPAEYIATLEGVDCGQPPCPADLVVDGGVGVKDLLFLLGTWGPCPKKGDCPADLVVDGVVGVKDLLFLLGAWGPCP